MFCFAAFTAAVVGFQFINDDSCCCGCCDVEEQVRRMLEMATSVEFTLQRCTYNNASATAIKSHLQTRGDVRYDTREYEM